MRALRACLMRFGSLFNKQRDRDLTDEIESHLHLRSDDSLHAGMAPEEARRRALLKLGGVEQTKEKYHERRGFPWLDSLLQDIRFGFRMLRWNPGFTTVAVITLALGIGANTAIFSIVNTVMLRLLPVKDPRQLMLFTWDASKKLPPNRSQTGADMKYSFSYPEFAQFQQQNQVLSSAFAFVPLGFSSENVTVNRNGEATSADGIMVTGGYFSGLGVTPLAGRMLNEADEQPGAPRVAVISYAYWSRRFGRDAGIIGNNVTLNSVPFTIVGVTPPAFYGVIPGTRPDVYIAFDDSPNLRPWSAKPSGSDSVYTARGWLCLNIMGRLKPGMSRVQAQTALDITFGQFLTQNWKLARLRDVPGFSLTPAAQGLPYLRGFVSQPLLLLMGAVGIVLLIACANVATLLLARGSARIKEISVRLAIGASRARLVRQLLTENLIISLLGGVLGFLFAEWGTQLLLALPTRGQFAAIVDIRPDARVLLFTLAGSLITGILFGLAPALRASRVDLAATMNDSAADFFGSRDKHRLGQSLVVAQIAGCLMLMIAAGLFLRTLVNLARNNFGFNQTNLLTFGLDPTRDGYQGDRLINFYSQLLERIQSLPGVNDATLIEFPPFSSVSNNSNVTIPSLDNQMVYRPMRSQTVGPDFFKTMQIPLLLGRGIEQGDTRSAPKVVVIDETMAKAFFGNQNPIGQRIGYSTDPKSDDTWEIVGVAKAAELTDVHSGVRSKAYFSYPQHPLQLSSMYFEVRSSASPESVISELRDAVRRADPNLPLLSLQTQTEIRDGALTGERIIARLSTFFGLLALILAVIGLYGTIAYAVARKTHDIGIRMALGAAPTDVLRLVVGQGSKLAGIGVAIGIVTSLGVTHLIRSLMFGVTVTDPLTFVGAAVLLLLVAVIACLIPAHRAMRVDPMVALRHE